MKREVLDIEAAVSAGKGLKWVLIYRNDGLKLGKVADLNEQDFSPDNFNEVRFFSQDEEIHIFKNDAKTIAVRTTGEKSEAIEREYNLDHKFGEGSVLVRYYIAYDGDGQAYITKTCLSGLEE